MSFFDQFPVQAFNHLDLLANQVVEGFIIGMHKSPFHGFSVEFAEHRLYNQGESTKEIDWKVYARTDKLFSKKFEEETNLRCQIVIDTSSSMYFPEEKFNQGLVLNKFKFSALGAACLMNVLKRQRDAFGLSLFDQSLHTHSHAKSSTTHYQLLLSFLDKYLTNPTQKKSTSATDALHQIADQIHKRSLVIIFSDMFDDKNNIDELFAAINHLKHNKHEVILFHVLDKKYELDFEFENRPYEFVDMETGERIKLQTHQIKEKYITQITSLKSLIQSKSIQHRVEYIEADINMGYDYILQSFFVKRKKNDQLSLMAKSIKLSKINPEAPKGFEKEATIKKTKELVTKIGELSEKLYAEKKHNLLIVFQGMDASGKDGVTKNVMLKIPAVVIDAHSFKKPSEEEFAHDFLWRVNQYSPAKGQIKIFIRSHYEDILIQRVHNWIDDKKVKQRMKSINAYETTLAQDNNTTILKFYLHLSHERQLEKLDERLTDPTKQWKHNPADYEESKLWDQYMKCYEYAINESEIPWHIVPSDQRWYRNYFVAQIVHDTLKKLKPEYPLLQHDGKTKS